MRCRPIGILAVVFLTSGRSVEAQWTDPKLIAGQVGFNVAVSFFGQIFHGESPGRAIKTALADGAVSGALAHTGYCITGRNPDWTLVGKALAQKSALTTKRSLDGKPVFDRTLLTHWELTYSFVHIEWLDEPDIEIDAINAAFSSYYLLAGDPYRLDASRSLLSGSLVFENVSDTGATRGFYVPGVVWIREADYDDRSVLGHELVHSLQAERGSSIDERHFGIFRVNWLAFASGVPAFVSGWPAHDRRPHEIEADAYSTSRR